MVLNIHDLLVLMRFFTRCKGMLLKNWVSLTAFPLIYCKRIQRKLNCIHLNWITSCFKHSSSISQQFFTRLQILCTSSYRKFSCMWLHCWRYGMSLGRQRLSNVLHKFFNFLHSFLNSRFGIIRFSSNKYISCINVSISLTSFGDTILVSYGTK